MGEVAKRVITLFVINSAVVLSVALLAFGWSSTIAVLGGAKSFGATLGVIGIGLAIIVGLFWVALHDYSKNPRAMVRDIVIGLILVVGLMILGLGWVTLPTGAAWRILAALAIILLGTIAGYKSVKRSW